MCSKLRKKKAYKKGKKMKKYKYETIQIRKFFKTKEHRKLIESLSKEGWKYIGSVPTMLSKNNTILEVDLIFEKEKE